MPADFEFIEFRDSAVGRQACVRGSSLAVWEVAMRMLSRPCHRKKWLTCLSKGNGKNNYRSFGDQEFVVSQVSKTRPGAHPGVRGEFALER